MKDKKGASYILEIKIYRDWSKRLFELSQSTYMNKMIKWFIIEEFKRLYLRISHEIHISKDMLQFEKDMMEMISQASAIRSIIYAMLCTKSYVYYALSIMSRY